MMPSSVKDILLSWHVSFTENQWKKVWRAAPLCLFWTIWKERNRKVFENFIWIKTVFAHNHSSEQSQMFPTIQKFCLDQMTTESNQAILSVHFVLGLSQGESREPYSLYCSRCKAKLKSFHIDLGRINGLPCIRVFAWGAGQGKTRIRCTSPLK